MPTRNRGDCVAALVALGDDPLLLLCAPGAPPAGSRKYFQPANRLRLGFVQKLSVRHVSSPLDSGQTIADQHLALKVGPKGRLRFRRMARDFERYATTVAAFIRHENEQARLFF
jgi:hypothetical protein